MGEDGYYYIVDRKKDMIIVNGYNVYPKEVEEVLYHHSAIIEAAVIGNPHPETGKEVTAFIATNGLVNQYGIIAYCKKHLAKYKVPSTVIILKNCLKTQQGKF
jgi:acyl-CoA synthetase (AMP-forming)/AMP-acid ligase II